MKRTWVLDLPRLIQSKRNMGGVWLHFNVKSSLKFSLAEFFKLAILAFFPHHFAAMFYSLVFLIFTVS